MSGYEEYSGTQHTAAKVALIGFVMGLLGIATSPNVHYSLKLMIIGLILFVLGIVGFHD